ncbi:heat shock 70 kDa protein 16 [Hordeum vulgare]|nr:heat shock 70 kDa protein 16 [Hordeum vulgare]
MHDLAATALCYGLYRSDLGVAGKPTFVAFVDVGHSDTQAGVVAFDPSGMKVKTADNRILEDQLDKKVIFDYVFRNKRKSIYFLNK